MKFTQAGRPPAIDAAAFAVLHWHYAAIGFLLPTDTREHLGTVPSRGGMRACAGSPSHPRETTLTPCKPQSLSTTRRFLLAAGLGALAAVGATVPASATDYPTQSVRILIGFQPGGVSDTIARVVGDQLSRQMGQPFAVEGRPGAGGMLSMGLAAAAPADGYTIYLGQPVITISPNFRRKLDFHPIKSFAPVSLLGLGATMMVVDPGLPVNSIPELIAYARTKPEGIFFGHSGQGSTNHLAGELFKVMAGVNLTPVAYKGAQDNILGLMRGEVQISFMPVLASLPQIKAGKLKGIGITGSQRSPAAPDVPTVGETITGYDVPVWYGFLVPAATPAAIVEKLNAEIRKALEVPAVKERLAAQGVTTAYTTTKEFADFITADAERWAKLVEKAGIVLD